jgi:single-strand DNA-binding protein
MTSLNKVILIGNLGRDPEVRYTQGGRAVANFTMATNERWKDKAGNRQERTEWHSIVAWGPKADFVQNYLKKGRRVLVEGKLQTRDWTDNQNVKHYKTEIVADNIQFMDAAGAGEGGPRQGGGTRPERGAADRGAPPEQGGPPPYADDQGGDAAPEGEYLEDDIPF